jgi:hypothetical protein
MPAAAAAAAAAGSQGHTISLNVVQQCSHMSVTATVPCSCRESSQVDGTLQAMPATEASSQGHTTSHCGVHTLPQTVTAAGMSSQRVGTIGPCWQQQQQQAAEDIQSVIAVLTHASNVSNRTVSAGQGTQDSCDSKQAEGAQATHRLTGIADTLAKDAWRPSCCWLLYALLLLLLRLMPAQSPPPPVHPAHLR